MAAHNPGRRLSAEQKARRRNGNIAKRNQKKAAANPLFAAAGVLDQVVQLEAPIWDARRVTYFDLAAGIESYEAHCCREQRNTRTYVLLRDMLIALITAENTEEIEANYAARWQQSTFAASMYSLPYRINFLTRYIAQYTKCTPLAVFEEQQRRYTERYGDE